MRMQFREKIEFVNIAPPSFEQGASNDNRGDKITTYGRLAYPATSQISVQQTEIDESSSALYHVRYTQELEPILTEPQSWEMIPSMHPKLKNKQHTIISADLDMRGKMLEVRI